MVFKLVLNYKSWQVSYKVIPRSIAAPFDSHPSKNNPKSILRKEEESLNN
jgi:hypothetical protein